MTIGTSGRKWSAEQDGEKTMGKEITSFGERIIFARHKKGLSRERLGKLVGAKCRAVCDWELGNKSPRVYRIPKIAEVLEVSQDWLMGKEDTSSLDDLTEITKSVKQLTPKQQQLVIDNEHVIKVVFQKFGRQHYLDCETYADFYGDAAIALCRAASMYDETQSSSFFSYAYVSVKHVMDRSHSKNRAYYHYNDTSLNKIIATFDNGDDFELEDTIPDPEDEFEKLEEKILVESAYQKITPLLTPGESVILKPYLQGKLRKNIAKTLGITEKAVANRIFLIRKKCRTAFTRDEMFS